MKNRVILLCILLLTLLLPATEGNGQTGIPRLISYQGVLTDKFNAPVADGAYTLTIRLYDVGTGGAPLWEELNSVTTFDGVFSTILGNTQPINLPFDSPYWLGIELQGELEMQPRLPLVTSPYAFNSARAQVADSLAGGITGVVRSLNTLQGDVHLVGEGGTTVRSSGDTLYIATGGDKLPVGTKEGDVIRWNATNGRWEPTDISLAVSPRLTGDGSTTAPLDIADMGANDGDLLQWDGTTATWRPGTINVAANTQGPLAGDGTTGNALRLEAGTARGQALYWDGSVWKTSAASPPANGDVLVWNATTGIWEPGREKIEVSTRLSGDGTPSSPLDLAGQGATQGQVLRWDATLNSWQPEDAFVIRTPPFTGNGTSANPLAIADGTNKGQMLFWDGTAWEISDASAPQNGDILQWNQAAGRWEPAGINVTDQAPLSDGSLWVGGINDTAQELGLGQANQVLTVNRTGQSPEWSSALRLDSLEANQLRVNSDGRIDGSLVVNGDSRLEGTFTANDSAAFNGPARFAQFPTIGLTEHALVVGDANNQATEFRTTGTAGAVLQQNANGGPTWSRNINLDTANLETLQVNGNTTLDGNLNVSGANVNLPNGSIDNTELANASVNVSYGTGVNGDATVALGGTLNLQNTGVTELNAGNGITVDQATGAVTVTNNGLLSATAGTGIDVTTTNGAATIANTGVTALTAGNGITVDQATGAVTITNNGLLSATAGTGIDVTTTNGAATIANTGVTSLTGTANQVIVDQATGGVTVSLPQDIHNDASPTFDGLTLDNINNASAANQILVSNNGAIESRSFNSLFPGGLLPGGTSNNSTLRWDGTNWVENTTVTADGSGNINANGNTTIGGDLTVNGTNVNLPNGSIDNTELANASVNVNYGTGINGDASVALGGTLNLQNTGVTALTAGNGITVDQATGSVTITNNGLLSATAGTGIDVTTTNGTATIANIGVTSLTGTANQVIVDQATGGVTVSLPQDIHNDASPTFDGLTLDNINNASAANQMVVSNNGAIESRSFNSLFPGGLLPGGTSNNSTLRWDGTNWVENTTVTADGSGNTTIGGDLTVNGTNVNLPNGSIDNTELANASVNVNYGTGINGDASVALGGTLNLQNTGVTELNAGNGITVDQATGSVTITNNGLLSATAGTGIDVTTTNGTATIANTGVTSLTGTANQVIVDQATGGVTVSLPQDIHNDASPTFDGLTLDNINNASAANQMVVSNNGAIESRSFNSLFPGGLLPGGTSNNSTLRWDGTNWVENTTVTADGSGNTTIGGDLTVNGTNVNLPNGSIDNTELANASVNVSYGTGINGDASVALGGTLNLQNTGVTALTAGNGITVDQATGAVTVTNNGLLSATAGTGIDVTTTNGAATIANTGVTSLTGTANQVIVDQLTGGVTVSLPQDIHNDASPTFDGLTLDNINNASAANQMVVSNNGTIESRSFNSLIGTLPLSENALYVGNASNVVAEFPSTNSTNAFLQQNSNGGPVWTPFSNVVSTLADSLENSFWKVTGNTATNPATNFIGTTDNQPLVVRVNNDTALRIIPATTPQIIGGNSANTISASTTGSVIVGGGDGPSPNIITTDYGAIVGGIRNRISAPFAFVGGGQTNIIDTLSNESVIGGGFVNRIDTGSWSSTIGGGNSNRIGVNSSRSTIGGGARNHVNTNSTIATISGGQENYIAANTSGATISGGFQDTLKNGSVYSTIGGGRNNLIDAAIYSTVGGGFNNRIQTTSANATIGGGEANSITFSGRWATISGGRSNTIDSTADYASIGGGQNNYLGRSTWQSRIGGGLTNRIRATTQQSTIAGGRENLIDTAANYAAIIGGFNNRIGRSSISATIGGGEANSITFSGRWATVSGGRNNTIDSTADYATIGGGQDNFSGRAAWHSTISGGQSNTVGNLSANATIGGGEDNRVTYSGRWATIGGGRNNTIDSTADYATVSGGKDNYVGRHAWSSIISGGDANRISATSLASAVGGGYANIIDSANYSVIAGGRGLTLKGSNSFGFLANPLGNNNMSISDDDVAIFGNTDLWLVNNDGAVSKLKFFTQRFGEGPFPSTQTYSSFEAPTSQTANIEYILPDTAGIVGDVLSVASVSGTQVTLDWGAGGNGSGWSLTGNASTNPTNNFIGTTDNQPLHIRVNNDTVMRYVPDPTSPMIYGGYRANHIGSHSSGSIIASGGDTTYPNTIGNGSTYNALSGGVGNEIQDSVQGSVIAGGKWQIIHRLGEFNAISGGRSNEIEDSASYSVISGGLNNHIYSNTEFSTISGGVANIIGVAADRVTIAGGNLNTIWDSTLGASIGGGIGNDIAANSQYTTIGGGNAHYIYSDYASTVSGGEMNRMLGNTRSNVIAGGDTNLMGTNVTRSAISGGGSNSMGDTVYYSVISGGHGNFIDRYNDYALIAGGRFDTIESNGDHSSILGGLYNTIGTGAQFSTIAGGIDLKLSGTRSFGFHAGGGFFTSKPMEVDAGYTAVFGNVNLWLANNDSIARQMRFYEPFNSTGAYPGPATSRAFFTSFEAPLLSDTILYILPATKGAAGDVMEIASVNGDRVTLEWDTDDDSSDRRFKKNIRRLSNALDSTLMLRGVRHGWKREEFPNRNFGDGEAIGFIAQEVEAVFPELVETESDGYKKVKYAKVTALLVEALRTQQDQLDQQQAQIDELRSMVQDLLNVKNGKAESESMK